MFAVIGLGNPGREYQDTRHNLGFWAVQSLAASLGTGGKFKQKGACLIQRVDIDAEQVLLVLPQDFMNRSGAATKPLLSFFKIGPSQLIVIHDELDFDPGIVRVKLGGSAAGHLGLEDIVRELGTQDFYRIRIGIGHPRRSETPLMEIPDWVLSVPRAEETTVLHESAVQAGQAAKTLIAAGLEAAQRKFH